MKALITEVQIVPVKPNNGLIAFASFVLDGKLYLSSIGIHKKLDGSGHRLTYPTKKAGLNIFYPISKELGKEIEETILNKLKEVMEGSNDRHSSFSNSI